MQGIVTADVLPLEAPGSPPQYACLLNAQGRHLHDLLLYRTAGACCTQTARTRCMWHHQHLPAWHVAGRRMRAAPQPSHTPLPLASSTLPQQMRSPLCWLMWMQQGWRTCCAC